MPQDALDELWQQLLPWLIYAGIAGLVSLLIGIIIWWSIFSKAGFHGARSLLLFIPFVNIIVFLMFAFGEWPLHREMDAMQQEINALRHQVTVLQYRQPPFTSDPGHPAVGHGNYRHSHPGYSEFPYNR